MESKQIDADWYAYQCKSGETLFYFNKTTGEHRWSLHCSAHSDAPVSLLCIKMYYTYSIIIICCLYCTYTNIETVRFVICITYM